MRDRPSDLFYVLVGRVVRHVLRGYLRHQVSRSRRKLVVAGVAGVAVGVGVAAVARRGRAGGGPEGSRGGVGRRRV